MSSKVGKGIKMERVEETQHTWVINEGDRRKVIS